MSVFTPLEFGELCACVSSEGNLIGVWSLPGYQRYLVAYQGSPGLFGFSSNFWLAHCLSRGGLQPQAAKIIAFPTGSSLRPVLWSASQESELFLKSVPSGHGAGILPELIGDRSSASKTKKLSTFSYINAFQPVVCLWSVCGVPS